LPLRSPVCITGLVRVHEIVRLNTGTAAVVDELFLLTGKCALT